MHFSLLKEMSVSTCNAVELSSLVPGTAFPKIELSEIIGFLESLVDCCGFADTVKSLISLISLCEACFSVLFCGKSDFLEPSFVEKPVCLRCSISEMLEESI